MRKTFFKEATVLSVFEFKDNERNLFGKFLYGFVIKDETNRFENNFRVITSSIDFQNQSEYITTSGNSYITDDPAELAITFAELVMIQDCLYSPRDILQMRQDSQVNDERKLH